jgi:valine dehydrogenase (NAD+)
MNPARPCPTARTVQGRWATGVFDVALRVFRAADDEGVSPAVAADRLAEERMRSVGRLSTIRLPR